MILNSETLRPIVLSLSRISPLSSLFDNTKASLPPISGIFRWVWVGPPFFCFSLAMCFIHVFERFFTCLMADSRFAGALCGGSLESKATAFADLDLMRTGLNSRFLKVVSWRYDGELIYGVDRRRFGGRVRWPLVVRHGWTGKAVIWNMNVRLIRESSLLEDSGGPWKSGATDYDGGSS